MTSQNKVNFVINKDVTDENAFFFGMRDQLAI